MDGRKTFIAGRLMRKILFCMAIFIIAIVLQERSAFAASNLEEGVSQLAEQISKNMQEKQKQKIAIIDFSDLNGNVTALGQFMAEELTTQLFMIAPGKFEVVERRQLLKLEEELMLGQTGFIEEKSIKKMGQVLGVDAIVTGSMTDLGNSVKINARLISVESAKVFAVAATDIPKTGMVADLIAKQVEGKQTSAQNKPTGNTSAKQEVKTEAKQNVEVKDFVFELQGCRLSGGSVTCSLIITNSGKDREIHFATSFGEVNGGLTRIVDDSGNEYQAKDRQLGNKQSDSYEGIKKLLVSGVPTKATLKFRDVSSDANGIALLEIAFWNDFKVQFRNIPLSR